MPSIKAHQKQALFNPRGDMAGIEKTLYSSFEHRQNAEILSKFGGPYSYMENTKQVNGTFEDSTKRSLAKTISWRIVASLDTLVAAAIILGDWRKGLVVMSIDFFVKLLLYFLHERGWNFIPWGRQKGTSHVRSIVKAISWRVVGTISTFATALIIGASVAQSLTIGAVDIVTKLVLYYFHERTWTRVTWGRVFKEKIELENI